MDQDPTATLDWPYTDGAKTHDLAPINEPHIPEWQTMVGRLQDRFQQDRVVTEALAKLVQITGQREELTTDYAERIRGNAEQELKRDRSRDQADIKEKTGRGTAAVTIPEETIQRAMTWLIDEIHIRQDILDDPNSKKELEVQESKLAAELPVLAMLQTRDKAELTLAHYEDQCQTYDVEEQNAFTTESLGTVVGAEIDGQIESIVAPLVIRLQGIDYSGRNGLLGRISVGGKRGAAGSTNPRQQRQLVLDNINNATMTLAKILGNKATLERQSGRIASAVLQADGYPAIRDENQRLARRLIKDFDTVLSSREFAHTLCKVARTRPVYGHILRNYGSAPATRPVWELDVDAKINELKQTNPTLSDLEISQRLRRAFHPDVNGGEGDDEARQQYYDGAISYVLNRYPKVTSR